MKNYLDLLQHIIDNGVDKEDRTGTGTRSIFGYQMRHDLSKGFPLVTTKRVHLKSIIYELLWFLKCGTNIKYLNDNGVHIWDEWADEAGYLGPIYGDQWRAWEGIIFNVYGDISQINIDQISGVIESIKKNPDSRRHIVSAWNVSDLKYMALPPCHVLFQFYVANGKLSLHLYQRSGDAFLGVPFNIASYALLLMMVAQVCDLEAGELIHSFGDVHIYNNHIDQVKLQLTREPMPLPTMIINPSVKDIDNFRYEDFKLFMYIHHPGIKGDVAI